MSRWSSCLQWTSRVITKVSRCASYLLKKKAAKAFKSTERPDPCWVAGLFYFAKGSSLINRPLLCKVAVSWPQGLRQQRSGSDSRPRVRCHLPSRGDFPAQARYLFQLRPTQISHPKSLPSFPCVPLLRLFPLPPTNGSSHSSPSYALWTWTHQGEM